VPVFMRPKFPRRDEMSASTEAFGESLRHIGATAAATRGEPPIWKLTAVWLQSQLHRNDVVPSWNCSQHASLGDAKR
jgi:hypothetical protein